MRERLTARSEQWTYGARTVVAGRVASIDGVVGGPAEHVARVVDLRTAVATDWGAVLDLLRST